MPKTPPLRQDLARTHLVACSSIHHTSEGLAPGDGMEGMTGIRVQAKACVKSCFIYHVICGSMLLRCRRVVNKGCCFFHRLHASLQFLCLGIHLTSVFGHSSHLLTCVWAFIAPCCSHSSHRLLTAWNTLGEGRRSIMYSVVHFLFGSFSVLYELRSKVVEAYMQGAKV